VIYGVSLITQARANQPKGNHKMNNKQNSDAALVAAANSIRALNNAMDSSVAEIGAIVDGAIHRYDGRGLSSKALFKLARLAKVPARKLGYCHEAYLVVQIAGDGLAERLPTGYSFDVCRQLARLIKAEGSLSWKKEAIIKAAEAFGRGLPNYRVGSLIDGLLAGYRPRTNPETSPYHYKPLSGLTMAIEAATMVATAA